MMGLMCSNIAVVCKDKSRLIAILSILIGLLLSNNALCSDRKPTSDPRTNYLLYCAGCHGLHAEGVIHRIPNLRESLPVFLSQSEGRKFVLSVPGVVNSQLDDEHLLDVMNYLRMDIGLNDKPSFTLAEIQEGRLNPIHRVRLRRSALLQSLNASEIRDY